MSRLLNYGRRSYGNRRTLSPREGFLILGIAAAIFLLVGLSVIWLSARKASRSNAIYCGSNLRQIGLACLFYANSNGGRWPDSFEQLMVTEDVNPEVFVCPDTTLQPAAGPTTRDAAAALSAGGHSSYIYLGKGLQDPVPSTMIVAYEDEADHAWLGMNVLFADGHIEMLKPKEVRKFIAAVQSAGGPVTWPNVKK